MQSGSPTSSDVLPILTVWWTEMAIFYQYNLYDGVIHRLRMNDRTRTVRDTSDSRGRWKSFDVTLLLKVESGSSHSTPCVGTRQSQCVLIISRKFTFSALYSNYIFVIGTNLKMGHYCSRHKLSINASCHGNIIKFPQVACLLSNSSSRQFPSALWRHSQSDATKVSVFIIHPPLFKITYLP